MAGKGKKRAGLGANPLDWIKDTSEAAEAASIPKAKPKRKPRAKKSEVQTVKTTGLTEVPKAEATEVPEVETTKVPEVKTQEVPEVQTKEVQEFEAPTVQEEESEQVQREETLELSEIITQEGLEVKPADEAFLVSDPLYRDYKEAQTRVPKYQQLDVKLYVLLRDDQLEFLAKLTREIMKNRTSEYKTERITKNTILRALIDNLKELEFDVRNIADEAELVKRISDAIRVKIGGLQT
ncbi:MAG: hypothetical protein WBZ42_08805 [Halobacteriota archaeon]